ncbi:NYN domain-containing protein [Cellulomonas massiliensis]|uniref:NYN domain-containing protein n=1 Tax=Cellulomonas massiliensis TaxID=1465811 RepID=UPI000370552B|nr:NYN domain-containing protein [Cellulomonas massiliensis]
MNRQHIPHGTAQARALCTGRTLYLIDIENMAGCSSLATAEVATIQARMRAMGMLATGDPVAVASSHHNALAAHFGWTGSAQRLVRSGPSGADQELLSVIADVRWISARYSRVVLASGDGIFANAIAELKRAGCRVTVVPPDQGLSKRLRLAAGQDVTPMPATAPSNVISLFPIHKDVM